MIRENGKSFGAAISGISTFSSLDYNSKIIKI